MKIKLMSCLLQEPVASCQSYIRTSDCTSVVVVCLSFMRFSCADYLVHRTVPPWFDLVFSDSVGSTA